MITEPTGHGDFGDGFLGILEQSGGRLDPRPGDVLRGRQPEDPLGHARKSMGGHLRTLRQLRRRDPFSRIRLEFVEHESHGSGNRIDRDGIAKVSGKPDQPDDFPLLIPKRKLRGETPTGFMGSQPLDLEVIVERGAIDQHLGILPRRHLPHRTRKHIDRTLADQIALPRKAMPLHKGLIDEKIIPFRILDEKRQILGFIEERLENRKPKQPFPILLKKVGGFADGFTHSPGIDFINDLANRINFGEISTLANLLLLMKKSTLILLIVVVAVCTLIPIAFKLLLIGFHSTEDATENLELWGGYQPETEYVLVRDVFLQGTSADMAGRRLVLVPEGESGLGIRFESAPETVAAFREDPEQAVKDAGLWFQKVHGIVEKGTKLRTMKLEHHQGWSAFFGSVQTLTPYAEILDGEFAGKKVDLSDVSWFFGKKEDFGVIRYKPEEKLLQAIKP